MSSPLSSPTTGQNSQLSPAQASFVYWLNGLAPILTSIVTPLATYWTLRKKPDKTVIQKYNQQVNEVVRQFVSGTVGLVGYFGGGETTKGLLNGLGGLFKGPAPMSESTKQVCMIVGGTVISFIGYAFIRPKISTELICKLLKQEEGQAMRTRNAVTRCDWMQRVQEWVDKTLVPDGKPQLRKTALVSAGFLTAYLGGGALGIGLLKHFFQNKAGGYSAPVSQVDNALVSSGHQKESPPLQAPANLYFAHRQSLAPITQRPLYSDLFR